MADNVLVDNNANPDYNVASDDDGTAQHQYVKLEWGPNNTFTKVDVGANAVPIQDGGNSITVDNAGTFLTQPTLQTGTNSIGDVRAITTSVTPGTSAGHLGKAEDAVHASGDTGVFSLAVRNDTAATVFAANGDYYPFAVDQFGRTHVVQISTSLTVGSAGLTIATTAYAAGDVLGNEFTFAIGSLASGQTSRVTYANLVTKSATVPGATELWLFDRASSPAADNAAFTWADADMLNFLGIVDFPAPTFTPNNGVAVGNIRGGFVGVKPNATSIFGTLVTRQVGGHTFFAATGDLQIKLYVEND